MDYTPRLVKKMQRSNNKVYLGQCGRINPVKLKATIKRRPPSTATITICDDTQIECRQLVKIITPVRTQLMYVKSIKTDVTNAMQRVVQCEGVYGLLDNLYLFGKRTPKVINANYSDTSTRNVLAWNAIDYLLKQSNDWELITKPMPPFAIKTDTAKPFAFSTVRQGWSFNGCSALDGLHEVQDCLPNYDCIVDTDYENACVNLYYVTQATAPTAELRESRNIQTMNVSYDASGMYNRLYLLGKNDLNIKNAQQHGYWYNGRWIMHESGKAYVQDTDSVTKYGHIDNQQSDTSRSDDDGLMLWGMNILSHHSTPSISISVKALELANATGVQLDRLEPGKMVRIPLPQYGLSFAEIISECTFDDLCADPYNCTLTIANQPKIMKDVLYKSAGGGASKKANNNNSTHCDINTKADTAQTTANDAKDKVTGLANNIKIQLAGKMATWKKITLADGSSVYAIVQTQ